MLTYNVSIARNVKKKLERILKEYSVRIISAIYNLQTDPRPSGCAKLSGYSNLFRIRIGSYRIIYLIDDDVRIIEVRRVFHRNDGY